MKRVGTLLTATVMMVVVSASMAVAAVKYGTGGGDFIRGTEGSDVLYGRGGSDFVQALEDDDILYGGDGRDLLDGQAGDDKIYGGGGGDEVFSFPGDDIVYGGGGSDLIFEGRGENVLYGAGGDDFFQATAIDPDSPGSEKTTPKRKDLIYCGSGTDTVVVDPGGVDLAASDCERVFVRTGSGDTRIR